MSNNIYIVQDSPGKGKGMYATQDIKRGTCVISEKPLLYVSQNPLINLATVETLSSKNKKAFFSLHNIYSEEELPRIRGIIKTNCLPLGTSSKDSAAVYRIISRINHSCAPNVNHRWNAKYQREDIYAIKDIPAGSEILTSYITFLEPRAVRQKQLERGFRFNCACEACTAEDSDERDRIITRFNECSKLIPIVSSRNPRMALGLVREALAQLDKIGGQCKGSLYYDAFRICAVYSNYDLAKMWATLFLENYVMETGITGSDYALYESYTVNPRVFHQAGMGGYVDLKGAKKDSFQMSIGETAISSPN